MQGQEGSKPDKAIVMVLNTASGPAHLIIPVENVDNLIEGLEKVKAEASSDLIVSSSMADAKGIAEHQDAIKS
jgi:hypothetical protein